MLSIFFFFCLDRGPGHQCILLSTRSGTAYTFSEWRWFGETLSQATWVPFGIIFFEHMASFEISPALLTRQRVLGVPPRPPLWRREQSTKRRARRPSRHVALRHLCRPTWDRGGRMPYETAQLRGKSELRSFIRTKGVKVWSLSLC